MERADPKYLRLYAHEKDHLDSREKFAIDIVIRAENKRRWGRIVAENPTLGHPTFKMVDDPGEIEEAIQAHKESSDDPQ